MARFSGADECATAKAAALTGVLKFDNLSITVASKVVQRAAHPLGQGVREAAARRRQSDPKYVALEKKHAVALAIADLVILHRTRSELTQEELAKRMHTSVSAISRLESGFHLPSLETLRKLAVALGGRVQIDIVDIEPPRTRKKSRVATA